MLLSYVILSIIFIIDKVGDESDIVFNSLEFKQQTVF